MRQNTSKIIVYTSTLDPTLADGIRNLSICMNNINEILGVVMAERLVPGTSPEVQMIEEASIVSQHSHSQSSKFIFPSSVANSRKPLKQKPLGDSKTWATAVSRGTKRAQQVKGTQPPSSSEARMQETQVIRQRKTHL
jgi:hypothetical protein